MIVALGIPEDAPLPYVMTAEPAAEHAANDNAAATSESLANEQADE